MFGATDLVKVTNLSSKPFTATYNSRDYILPPNKEVPVPGEVAMLWFGDPRSGAGVQTYTPPGTDDKIYVPDRESEVARLAVKYGHQTGDLHDYLRNEDGNNSIVPRVKLRTLEDEEIPSVLSDPSGNAGVAYISPNVVTQEDEISRLQRQVELLMNLAKQNDASNLPISEPEIPTDTPLDTPSSPLTSTSPSSSPILSNSGNEFSSSAPLSSTNPSTPSPLTETPFGTPNP